MISLPLPTDTNAQPFSAVDVFLTCAGMARLRLRRKLLAIRSDIGAAATDYDLKANNAQLYQNGPHKRIKAVTRDEMVGVYTFRMVPKSSTGRPIYDLIMSIPAQGRCPFCGVGTVNTLDHFLPKAHFPIYSVLPNNLVPACTWCQDGKDQYFATSEEGQLLHPYFDNLDDDIWLGAEVIEETPAAFRYFAAPPDNWPLATKARVAKHLEQLKLHRLFSSNAGSRLAEIRARLARLHEMGGQDAVRSHLQEDLASLEADRRNSWATAMYRAAQSSDWFCNGGFMPT